MSENDHSPADMAWWEDLRQHQLGPRHAKRTPRRVPRDELPPADPASWPASEPWILAEQATLYAEPLSWWAWHRRAFWARVDALGDKIARGLMDERGRREW